ncbi:MAG: hypothetical protein JWP97_6051 [Labilithrix sp.]|nr:hypothetical protein [Labilithrix sp.]
MLTVRGVGILVPLLGALACVALAPACAKTEGHGFYQDKDFQPPSVASSDFGGEGEGSEAPKFDRNNIVDTATLTDYLALDATLIQKFLHRTPYDRPTFLDTYQSNGVRAADAIARAARTYRINPLAFLVAAQGTQGLIGEVNYPFPPERVEYVFRCGCLQGSDCMAELAGFDKQVDCLGRQLRAALDQIGTNDQTDGGWGKDKTSTTLDNLKVTPGSEATAAIYDRNPRVQEGQAGGTWFFWNLFNIYALGADYSGPIGGASGGAWIGDKCTSEASCADVGEGAICATDYPEGLCTIKCTGDCPSLADAPEAFCADFGDNGGFCLAVCNPSSPSCRDGYKCVTTKKFGSTDVSDSRATCQVQ